MRVECFPDTNIFLRFKSLDEIDWRALLAADEVLLSVCITVIHELDEKKVSGTPARIRKRAQAALKRLEAWSLTQPTAEIRPGVRIRLLPQEPRVEWGAVELDPTTSDDRILAAMLSQADPSFDRRVLASADLGAKLKARARGLEAISLSEEDRLPDVASEQEAAEAQLRARIRELEDREPVLDLECLGAESPKRLSVRLPPPPNLDERGYEAILDSLRERLQRKLTPKPAVTGDLVFWGGVSEDELRRFKEEIPRYLHSYEAYLAGREHYAIELSRTAEVNLQLVNRGTAEAERVHIVITVPAPAMALRPEWGPAAPTEPKEPTPPRTLTALMRDSADLSILGRRGDVAFPRGEAAQVAVSGPDIPFGGGPTVAYSVLRLLHNFSNPLPPFLLSFPSHEEARSLELAYEIHTRNLLRPAKGKLAIIVKK